MSIFSEKERFWSFVGDDPDKCWEWSGHRLTQESTGEYGTFWADGKTVRAHRWAYEQFVGPIPEGLVVRHTCDNPPCVRPSHLVVGTQKENIADSVRSGRFCVPRPTELNRGELNGNSKMTNAQVEELRSLYTGKRGEQTQLAERFGISKTQVGRLLKRTW